MPEETLGQTFPLAGFQPGHIARFSLFSNGSGTTAGASDERRSVDLVRDAEADHARVCLVGDEPVALEATGNETKARSVRKKRRIAKTVLRLPDLEAAKSAVLNAFPARTLNAVAACN